MTREDAIYEIRQLAVLSTNKNIERVTEALNMAIEALQDEIWKDEPYSRKAEQTEPQYKDCFNCKYEEGDERCGPCSEGYRWYWEPKTEPINSEIPNNCEHITEDGVTCAKYPACDDCLDNPLNKVKGSERLLKGKDEPQTDFLTFLYNVINPNEMEEYRAMYEAKGIATKDEPQTDCAWK